MYQNTGGAIGALDTALTTGQRTAAGREFGLLLGGNAVQFRPDVDNQFTQTDFGLSPSLVKPQGDLNIFTPDFHLPAVIKASLGADKKLNGGWTLGLDMMYTKNIYEVDWVNVNFAPAAITTTGPDKRLIYSTTGNPTRLVYRNWSTIGSIRNPYTNIILVRNTTGQKGFAYNFTFTVDKQAKKVSISVQPIAFMDLRFATREPARSTHPTGATWKLSAAGIISRSAIPTLTWAGIFGLISKRFSYAKDHAATTIAFTYTGQSGSRYSYTMSNLSFIGDGVTNNDLMYIPASRAEMDQMTFVSRLPSSASQAANAADIAPAKDQFETFINSDKYMPNTAVNLQNVTAPVLRSRMW